MFHTSNCFFVLAVCTSVVVSYEAVASLEAVGFWDSPCQCVPFCVCFSHYYFGLHYKTKKECSDEEKKNVLEAVAEYEKKTILTFQKHTNRPNHLPAYVSICVA